MHTCRVDIQSEGLQDDCEECKDHAENPFSRLDHNMLSNLVVMALNMRMDKVTRSGYPRTENEAIARANVMNALEHAGKLMEVTQLTDNLDLVKDYYNRYWRIPLT